MSSRVHVNNEMLKWSITRAGYDLYDFFERYPPVKVWLDGKGKPTVKQLETFAKKVYLPFGFLFLPEPPVEEVPIPYFRSMGNRVEKLNVNVYDTILLLQQRQEWLSNYLRDNDFDPLSFVGRFQNIQDVDAIVFDIRRTLGLSTNWASEHKTWSDALEFLIGVLEDKGVIVSFNGVFENSTKRKIPVDECRGFVLVNEMAPFLFVNNADFKSAQMFTVAHELAHIWTGQSAGFDFRKMQPADDPTERLCDKIAAEFLVPETLFIEMWDKTPDVNILARYFKVSVLVIARRALDTGNWTLRQFLGFYDTYKFKEIKKNEKKSPGGDFFATTKKRLSVTFASHIAQAVKSGQLLYRDACKLTSLKGDTFQKFYSKLLN